MMKKFCLALIISVQVHLQLCSPLVSEGLPIGIIRPSQDYNEPHWFDQKLDHFDDSNTETWKQRYWIYDNNYLIQSPGYPSIPLFLIIGGEGAVKDAGYTYSSPMYDLGVNYRALMVHLEHRYYGESKPTEDLSTENLKYLSSRQALEDIVYFVEKIKEQYGMKCHNEVVVFGGSYSGALAAWARLLYPDIISVAQASGAPIEVVFDFSGYFDIVKKSIELYDENCASTIQQGAQKMQELMQTKEGLETMSEKFKTCTPLEDDESNKMMFIQQLENTIGYVAQYNGTKKQDIPSMCKLLTDNDKDDPIDKLAYYYITTQGGTCTTYSYDADIEDTKITEYRDGQMFRQFFWQECTEFAFFYTSDTDDSFFANTLSTDFYTNKCRDVFGDMFTPEYIKQQVDDTNSYYGGKDYTENKVLFVQGQLDPWQAAGITESNDEIGYKSLIIENVGHVRDLEPKQDGDPPQLNEAKEEIQKILKGWIEAVDFSNPPSSWPQTCED